MRRNSYKRNRAHVIGLIGEGKRNEMREREKKKHESLWRSRK